MTRNTNENPSKHNFMSDFYLGMISILHTFLTKALLWPLMDNMCVSIQSKERLKYINVIMRHLKKSFFKMQQK